MRAIRNDLVLLLTFLLAACLLVPKCSAYSDKAASYSERKYGLQKTLFVVEIVANGATTQDTEEVFGAGTPKGKLTEMGRLEASRLGTRRKNEYIHEKRHLSIKFNASSVLALSPLSKQGLFFETGERIIQSMYPLTDLTPMREVTYLTHKTPLKGTEFEKILS